MQLQGFFEEIGTTGMRDSLVFAALQNEGKIADDLNGWMQDPYDSSYEKGVRMNLSEKKEMDESFPEHPLSMARSLVQFINENN